MRKKNNQNVTKRIADGKVKVDVITGSKIKKNSNLEQMKKSGSTKSTDF